MNRDYKIGDWVIFIDKSWSDWWKKGYGIFLYGKIAKIIRIDNNSHLLEFKEHIDSIPKEQGKNGHCLWSTLNQIKSIDLLKFKKWIKGG